MEMARGPEATMSSRVQFAAAAALLMAGAGLSGCSTAASETPARPLAASMDGSAARAADDDAGDAFVSPDGEFSIALPETPHATRTPDGRAVYQLRTDDYAYTVNELDCPADFAGEADPDDLYDALQAASVEAVNGTLRSQRDVLSAGEHVAGREFVVHAATPGSGKSFEMVVRLFRVGNSVYLVQAIGPQTEASRDDMQAVIESFAVL
jgi:hypothetical protein